MSSKGEQTPSLPSQARAPLPSGPEVLCSPIVLRGGQWWLLLQGSESQGHPVCHFLQLLFLMQSFWGSERAHLDSNWNKGAKARCDSPQLPGESWCFPRMKRVNSGKGRRACSQKLEITELPSTVAATSHLLKRQMSLLKPRGGRWGLLVTWVEGWQSGERDQGPRDQPWPNQRSRLGQPVRQPIR